MSDERFEKMSDDEVRELSVGDKWEDASLEEKVSYMDALVQLLKM